MPTEAFSALSWIVASMAGGLGLYALLADWLRQRFKRRRRCPKCWYDLSHTSGRTCSECGYTASRERKLFKARRRRLLVGLALLLLVVSHAGRVTPAVMARGWAAAVPTTALIAALPWLRPDRDVVARHFLAILGGRLPPQLSLGGQLPFTGPGPREDLFLELAVHRVGDNTLSTWQEHWLRRICVNPAEPDPGDLQWNHLVDQVIGTTRWADGTRILWERVMPDPSVHVEIESLRVWPRDSAVYGRPVIRTVREEFAHSAEAVPITTGLRPFEVYRRRPYGCGRRPTGSRLGGNRAQLTFFGKPAPDVTTLEYDVTIYGHEAERPIRASSPRTVGCRRPGYLPSLERKRRIKRYRLIVPIGPERTR